MRWRKHGAVLLAVVMLWSHVVCEEDRDFNDDVVRWRDGVAAGIDLWQPLLVRVYDALAYPWDHGGERVEKRWQGIRSELVLALEKNPDSPSYVDVKLCMAIMDGEFRKDKADAIQQLKLIRAANSKTPTIHGAFGVWKGLIDNSCLRSGSKYTVLPSNEIIRRMKDARLRDNFACIKHLERFPIMASEIATLELADVYAREGLLDESATLLETFLDEQQDMMSVVAEDKKRSLLPNGSYISSIKRPAARAVNKLMVLNCRRGKMDAAIAIGETIGLKLSENGWYCELINEPLAGLYLKQGKKSQAQEQYIIALSGYLEDIKHKVTYLDSPKQKHVPLSTWLTWDSKIKNLKRAINTAGGNVDIDSKELESIIDQKEKTKSGCSLEHAEVIKTLREMHSGKGKYADPRERKSGVAALVNLLKEQGVKTAKDNRNDTNKIRKTLATALVQMSVVDEDADVRKAMLDTVNKLIYQPVKYDAGSIQDADKQKVNHLLAQITGKDVEEPVPYPETNLADMNASALLYAAKRVSEGALSLDANRWITKALVNSENPALYTFFENLAQDSEDSDLKKFAVRGLERIINNADIDENGMILISE